MGSFKQNGRNQGPDRRRGGKGQRKRGLLNFESLESRALLAVGSSPWQPTSTNLADVRNGPMANEGQILINLYQAYLRNSDPSSLAAQFPTLQLNGDAVNIYVSGTGDYVKFVTSLQNLGMSTSTLSPAYFRVDGFAPISALPQIAQLPETLSAGPNEKPSVRFVGKANNEADHALFADVAKTQFGVTGAGVTVGVLSDSAGRVGNGIADSVATGDLAPAPATTILAGLDGPAGSTDEGRAMMENIHDIAPGAALQFATAGNSDATFAASITALAKAGSNLLVDDIGFSDEPFFQDGLIQQAVDATVGQGKTYFSAAGNTGNQGYLSRFRAASTTVGTLGAGTYMNFAPSGAAVTQLPITVGTDASAANPVVLLFQFDQPFATQQVGGGAGPTSEVDFYVLDSTGAIAYQSTNNNVAIREPRQQVLITTPGSYTVVMKVASGPNPGHVEFVNFNENATLTVNLPASAAGGAGGTSTPSSYGHSAQANTIGVGAVPWWATSASGYTNQIPLGSEPFSSYGPSLTVFNPDGTAKAAAVATQNPTVSGADGGNTSFFGQVIDTSRPPFPGEPASSSNLSQNLPSFFGTSSAAPNVTAVAALMLQKSPSLTPAQIKAGLIKGATPLNGAAAGAWNAQGGFGIVNAVNSINAISGLAVVATTPSSGVSLTSAPSEIDVTFNHPVDITSLKASDLVFTSLPSGVASLVVGTPVGIDSPTFPTMVRFPISYSLVSNQSGNGSFAYTINGPILAQDGTKLTAAFNGTYSVNDVNPPHVIGTTVNGRIVTVTFDKALAPTLGPDTVFVAWQDAAGRLVNLDNDPRFKMSWNSVTDTVTLDYSGLNQSQLPSAAYRIVVRAGNMRPDGTFEPGITDLSGNKLDGTFYGTFPSGYRGTPGPTVDENFVQNLGFLQVTAPQITALKLVSNYDTGIPGDENTATNGPVFVGQVAATFPASAQGVSIQAQFSGLHGGNTTLAPQNGRGSNGAADAQVLTDASGTFLIPDPAHALALPEGFQRVALVAIGQPDAAPLPGLSSAFNHAFRIDQTSPNIVSATIGPVAPTAGTSLPVGDVYNPVSSLTSISLDVVDPASGTYPTPPSVVFPAVDPATATNISNYSLIRVDPVAGNQDNSSFIKSATFTQTGSDFVSAPNRAAATDPYRGRIDLAISPGLPAGKYTLIVHTKEGNFGGLTDAAGNPLNNTPVAASGTPDFYVSFNIQPQPLYVSTVSTDHANAQGNTLLPYSYYEINPRAGDIVTAPPTTFNVDFSTQIDPSTVNNDTIQILRTANTAGGTPDGDFGTLGQGGLGSRGAGFSRFNPAGAKITLTAGPNGPNSRLVLSMPANTVWPADHYRLYIPNNSAALVLRDIFHNQLDGEFLGNPTSTGGSDGNGNPQYEDLLPNGQYRSGMSGDGIGGGSFMTSFEVVPTGNIVYARPDYVEDPLLSSTTPDGSVAKPYTVLAPQAALNNLNSSTYNNGDPNGGLNASINFTNFDPNQDRGDLKVFARSAFYAASQLSSRGPVVVVALPGASQRDPVTGNVTQRTFVLQTPAATGNSVVDGSASVPFDTTLVFNAGTTVKFQNASLFVQNQGSALQTLGGTNPSDHVTFTSIADNSVGANPNGPAGRSNPAGGDWGGIVFRNFNESIAGRTDTFPVDGTLTGPNGSKAVSGADDGLSSLSFTDIRYAGGAVPATRGTRYDSVTLYNSRPALTQDTITLSANGTSTQASISGDLDSFREDDTRRGPLIRRVSVAGNSLNGILIRPAANGVIESTDAIVYPQNSTFLGGSHNYTFDAPLPYLLVARMELGTQLLNDTPNQTTTAVTNRVYVQPGMLFKFQRGAGIEVVTPGASMNVGDRTYISGFDSEATLDATTGLPTSPYGPGDPSGNFRTNSSGDARVLFTSLYDNTATTSYTDPLTKLVTTIVPMVDSANTDPTSKFGAPGPNDPNQPTPGNVPTLARWGSITYDSGAYGVIDEADIRYGGGDLNIAGGTTTREVLSLLGGAARTTFQFIPGQGFVTTTTPGNGARVKVTNNNFSDNAVAPIGIDPDGLLAVDPLRPLASGHPFFHGNVLQRNGFNALDVLAPPLPLDASNLSNDSIWDQTDITYILRGTIVPDAGGRFFNPPPNPGNGTPAIGPIPKPSVVLTIQSAVQGTLLADGTSIPSPGLPVVVKLLGGSPGDGVTGNNGVGRSASNSGGAGFVFGFDNLVDPTTDPTIDQGNNSQLRILGVAGNESTHQAQVPVYITSAHDNTIGVATNGVIRRQIIDNDTTPPKAGDGGLIAFGGNSLTTFNALDVREGNRIDNADIRYISRIEMQGGGNINYIDANASNSFDAGDNPDATKRGVYPNLPNGQPDPRNAFIQSNANKELTISDSKLSSFRDVGVLEHPGGNVIAGGVRSGIAGEPNLLFMYNSTVANMPVGIRGVADTGDNTVFPDPNELLLLNNTFYNNAIGVDIVSTNYNTTNTRSHFHFLAMDNIFANSATTAIQNSGQVQGSELEYNLFWQNGAVITDLGSGLNSGLSGSNFGAINADPMFVNPAAGNFNLKTGSAAIDAGRSELALNPDANGAIVGTLIPIDNQVLNANGGIRNNNSREPDSNNFDLSNIPNNLLTLPGYFSPTDPKKGPRGYVDQFVATTPTDPNGIAGPTSDAATNLYLPLEGQRDILGNLRQKDPTSSNVGFGSQPFYDLGAFEHRVFNPPHVTGVTAVVTDPASATGTSIINIYGVGTYAGTNKPVQTIQVTFDSPIDPTTVNGSTVVLEASNGTGLFTNPTLYNLSGKVSLDSTNRVLTINVGAAGLTLNNDEYRLILSGSGAAVIKDTTGLPIDGQNTAGGNPNFPQLPLPSGSGTPGTNFYDTFVINTAPPSVSPATLQLDPSTDSNVAGDAVTKVNLPSYSGSVSVPLPSIESVFGLTVVLDISTQGNGVFDRLNAGTAKTDALGRYVVTVGKDAANTGLVTNTSPLPDSPYTVGRDGILRTGDDSGYTWARVRVIDQSGNASNQPTDSPAQFTANNALIGTVIDTTPPNVTSVSPSPNTLVQPSGGSITFSFTADKNLDPKSLTASSILVFRAGPDGLLGTADDVAVPINASSISTAYLGGTRFGPERVTFTVNGTLPNDYYGLSIKGTGTAPVTDVAGNPIGGGVDYGSTYIVSTPNSPLIFVQSPATAGVVAKPDGSLSAPYPTIKAAVAAAAAGDTVAVLPGVYTENVVLKPYVKLSSADLTSTATTLVPGNALQTIIRAPASALTNGSLSGTNATVSATNIAFIPGIETEVTGFTIASPLFGNPARGPIDPTTIGVMINNAAVLLDRDYIVDAQIGVQVVTPTGTGVLTPRIYNDVIAGNANGVVLVDQGATSVPTATQIRNTDFVYNTYGLNDMNLPGSPVLANLANTIFWQNHDQTAARNGYGILASSPNNLTVRNSLFSGNGASDTSPTFAGVNVGNGFVPANLKATPDALGNFTGNPAFVFPVDPRPGSDGPATFFLDANFDLTATSAAIDRANNTLAPATDFLFRSRVVVPGHAFPGTGPADVGAFEYKGSGGTTVGGAFRVATTSLNPTGGALSNGSSIFTAQTAPKAITVTFSGNVNKATVTPSALLLYGDGLNPVGPARATSVTWLNNYTAVFKISGGYSNQGSVAVRINTGAIQSTTSSPIQGFSDFFRISSTTPAAARSVAPAAATTVAPLGVVAVTPVPSASPKPTVTVKTPVASPTAAPYTPPPAGSPSVPRGPMPVRKFSFVKKK